MWRQGDRSTATAGRGMTGRYDRHACITEWRDVILQATMPTRPPTYRGPKPVVRPPDNRPSAASRGYGSDWRDARLAFLADHPLCAQCEREGRLTGADVVDHITPHRGDAGLFWDEGNWQSLCKRCHDRKTGRGQ